MIGRISAIGIVILIVVLLYPMITTQLDTSITQNSSASDALTTASDALTTTAQLVPIAFVIIVLMYVLGLTYKAFRDVGLMGFESEPQIEEQEEVKPEKPHKQTYLEYVKERLAVENLLKWRI